MTAKRLPGFIYQRVSSDRQEDEGYSLPEQDFNGRACLESLGADCLGVYVDVESGRSTEREHFNRMCRDLRRLRATRVLVAVESRSRLYRNLEDHLKLEKLLPLGVEFHLWRERETIKHDQSAMGRFTGGLKALVTRLYSDDLSENARKGMTGKARQGHWPTVAPLGYLNRAEPDGRRVVVPDPDRKAAVRELFARCAAGSSLADLRAWAREIGLRKPKAVRPMSRSQIEAVIRQPFYMGEIAWAGEVFQSLDEPLVSAAEWQAANDAMTARTHRGHGARRHDHAYGHGLIACGSCGASVVGDTKRKAGKAWEYYRCSRQRGPCDEGYIRMERIEEQLGEVLGQLRLAPDMHEILTSAVRDLQAEKRKAEGEELTRARSEDSRLADRLTRSYDAYLDGLVTADEHREAAARMRGDQARLRARVAELEAIGRDIDETGIEALELARGASWALPRIHAPRVKRLLVGWFLDGLKLQSGRITWAWRAPWDQLIRTHEIQTQSGMPPEMGTWLAHPDRIRTLTHRMPRVPADLRPVLEMLRAA